MGEYKYSQKFEQIFNLTRRISRVCGGDVIKENYRICKRTVFVFLLVNIAIGFTFYTMYVDVKIERNYYNILKSISVLRTGVQGYAKLVNVIKQQNNMRFLHKEIREMYTTYESKSLTYKKCLKDSISLVKKLLITLFSTIVLISLIVILLPVYMLVVLKIRVEILTFKLPFIDYGSDFGFYFIFGIHIVCVLFGGFGNFVIDSWLFIYAAHIPLIKNILKCKFDDLDTILEADPKDSEKSSGPLYDIFKWHKKYIVYCKTIKSSYFWVIFVQISTDFIGIVFAIVIIFLDIWPPAPAYLFYLFVMIYSYCSLGNLVETSNDDITTMIYDSCWYNLTVKEQKMLLIMLRESQQATGMSIGGVAPLSMSMALQLTKTIYTFSMMLMEFMD